MILIQKSTDEEGKAQDWGNIDLWGNDGVQHTQMGSGTINEHIEYHAKGTLA